MKKIKKLLILTSITAAFMACTAMNAHASVVSQTSVKFDGKKVEVNTTVSSSITDFNSLWCRLLNK